MRALGSGVRQVVMRDQANMQLAASGQAASHATGQ